MEQPNVTVEQKEKDELSMEDAGQAFADLVNESTVTAEDEVQEAEENANNIEDTNEEVTDNQNQEAEIDDEQPTDIWANAPDELRDQFQSLQAQNTQLESNVKANSNRVSALTKKLNGVTQQQSQQPSMAEKLDLSQIQGKGFDEIKEDFPELAEFVQDFTSQALSQQQRMFEQKLEPMQSHFQTQQQNVAEENVALEQQSFAKIHPDAQEINNSAEFWTWYDSQSPAVQALRTPHAADNIAMLNLYKADSPQKPPPSKKPNLSEHLETPRKGSSSASGNADKLAESDPGKYFEMIS